MALSPFAWGALLVAALCAAAGAYLLLKLRRVAPEPAPILDTPTAAKEE